MPECTPKQEIPQNTVREWISQTWLVKTQSDQLLLSLKEMIATALKYNVTISAMRAPQNLRLNMPAFHHPYAKNRNLHTKTMTMKCLQDTHKAKTIRDLMRISAEAMKMVTATVERKNQRIAKQRHLEPE